MKIFWELLLVSLSSQAIATPIPRWVEAAAETDPIPVGQTHTDDAAIWRNDKIPEKSLILGTSKYGKDNKGGLGVYDLSGRELQFIQGNKLNSVDIIDNLAIATNRSARAIDLFSIQQGFVEQIGRQALRNQRGQSIEPYGLCLGPKDAQSIQLFLPLKDGHLLSYQVQLTAPYAIEQIADYDLSRFVTEELDARIRDIVYKSAAAEGELEDLDEAIAERFILEGCVFDPKRNQVYVGMENAGIWSISLSSPLGRPRLLVPVTGSWTDFAQATSNSAPRISDDIEGLDLFSQNGRDYLLISVQGLSEFALFDLAQEVWQGNVKIRFGDDTVSTTDGLAVNTGNFGGIYSDGIVVVHDDQNTQGPKIQDANYKIISLSDLWQGFFGYESPRQPY